MKNTASEKVPFWLDPKKRAIFFQFITLCMVGLLAYYLISNTIHNLKRQNIATGFGFLHKASSFEIGESLIRYSAANSYGRALIVGALNTLYVSSIGVIITIILGTIIGVARLSSNWLLSKLAAIYIEVFQDIPVLLQLFFWYSLFYTTLPTPRQALHPLPGCLFVQSRGLKSPFQRPTPHMVIWRSLFWPAAFSFISSAGGQKSGGTKPDSFSRCFGFLWPFCAGIPLLTWWLAGAPTAMSTPKLVGFNFTGGKNFSPEFIALLLGLVLYTAAFVAEVVRAGIQSVSKGQTEAAMALGLRPGMVLNLVILPQALRVIIPPLTSQMLNLTKNSTLAVAIGYPDFVSVADTTINQTGQAIEGVALIMALYLIFSLLTSAIMNWYNKKAALVER